MDQRRWEFETGYRLEVYLARCNLKENRRRCVGSNLRKRNTIPVFDSVIDSVSRKIKNEPESNNDTSSPSFNSEDKNLGPLTGVDNSLSRIPPFYLVFLIEFII